VIRIINVNIMPVKKKEATEQTDRYCPQASDHPLGLVQMERESPILTDGKILCDTVKRIDDRCTLMV
jgi:L-2-hydroxyglutarate oxidase LhgO